MPRRASAQEPADVKLEKMPADLETDWALSALPPHLRAGATVYLLDPAKGYYKGRQGTNGFVCLISRTDWEWGEYRNDIASPISYDAEGAKAIFPVDSAVAAMRASGKFTALQIKDTMIRKIKAGIFRAPAKGGISYMLAPVMRVHTGNPGDPMVMTMHMPHYMFFAPWVSEKDMGGEPDSPQGPWVVNPANSVLGEGKGPFGYIILTAGKDETAKIVGDGQDLLKRLEAYKAYLRVDEHAMQH